MPVLEPENITAWTIFQTLMTQFRTAGLGGFVGFDYTVLPFLFKAHDVPESEQFLMLDKINLLSQLAHKYFKPPEPVEKTDKR
jgi:hypothetical protein